MSYDGPRWRAWACSDPLGCRGKVDSPESHLYMSWIPSRWCRSSNHRSVRERPVLWTPSRLVLACRKPTAFGFKFRFPGCRSCPFWTLGSIGDALAACSSAAGLSSLFRSRNWSCRRFQSSLQSKVRISFSFSRLFSVEWIGLHWDGLHYFGFLTTVQIVRFKHFFFESEISSGSPSTDWGSVGRIKREYRFGSWLESSS